MTHIKTYSKLMSLVLRHAPEELGLTLDAHGWVGTVDLIQAIHNRFNDFSGNVLSQIVAENEKKRFEFDVTGTKIRACQGHSVNVDLQLESQRPPAYLYHGTSHTNIESIKASGLKKMARHAVHLSSDRSTAWTVGKRQGGQTRLIVVWSGMMDHDGYKFYKSTNGVWLTDEVPPTYIEIRD